MSRCWLRNPIPSKYSIISESGLNQTIWGTWYDRELLLAYKCKIIFLKNTLKNLRFSLFFTTSVRWLRAFVSSEFLVSNHLTMLHSIVSLFELNGTRPLGGSTRPSSAKQGPSFRSALWRFFVCPWKMLWVKACLLGAKGRGRLSVLTGKTSFTFCTSVGDFLGRLTGKLFVILEMSCLSTLRGKKWVTELMASLVSCPAFRVCREEESQVGGQSGHAQWCSLLPWHLEIYLSPNSNFTKKVTRISVNKVI